MIVTVYRHAQAYTVSSEAVLRVAAVGQFQSAWGEGGQPAAWSGQMGFALGQPVFAQEPAPSSNDLLRDTATPLEPLAPGAVGKAELRGVHWKARNVADVPLAAGQRCRVAATEELMLHLVPE